MSVQTTWNRVSQQLHGLFSEAKRLLWRRRFHYAIFAAVLAAGGVLVSSLQLQPEAAHTATPPVQPAHNNASNPTITSETDDDAAAPNTETPPSGHSSATVTINGEDIPVPENGTVHKDISDGTTQPTVDVSHRSSGDTNRTSYRLRVHNHSTTREEVDIKN